VNPLLALSAAELQCRDSTHFVTLKSYMQLGKSASLMKEAAIMCFSPPLRKPCDETLVNTLKQSTQQSPQKKKKQNKNKERGPKFKFKPIMTKPQSGLLKVRFTLGVRDSSVEFLNTILVI
jgi:hypothetical protein